MTPGSLARRRITADFRVRVALRVVRCTARTEDDQAHNRSFGGRRSPSTSGDMRIWVRPARSESSQSSAGTSPRSSSTDGRRSRHKRRIPSMDRCSAASTSSSRVRSPYAGFASLELSSRAGKRRTSIQCEVREMKVRASSFAYWPLVGRVELRDDRHRQGLGVLLDGDNGHDMSPLLSGVRGLMTRSSMRPRRPRHSASI